MKRPNFSTPRSRTSSPSPQQPNSKTVNVSIFRSDLFSDLRVVEPRHSSDWVIKDDLFGVGDRRPSPGWSLDAGLKQDTGRSLQVMGRVRVHGGIVTLEAARRRAFEAADLGLGPRGRAHAARRPAAEGGPPGVCLSRFRSTAAEVPPDAVFQIRFGDMDEASLKQRVRYAGRPQPQRQPLDAVRPASARLAALGRPATCSPVASSRSCCCPGSSTSTAPAQRRGRRPPLFGPRRPSLPWWARPRRRRNPVPAASAACSCSRTVRARRCRGGACRRTGSLQSPRTPRDRRLPGFTPRARSHPSTRPADGPGTARPRFVAA